jgi:hypothetical protein
MKTGRTPACVRARISRRLKVKIKQAIERFPGGMMVIPLLWGSVLNTFAPRVLGIGSFSTQLAWRAADSRGVLRLHGRRNSVSHGACAAKRRGDHDRETRQRC